MDYILNNRHRIYLQKCTDLVCTIQIKHQTTCDLISEGLHQNYGIDESLVFDRDKKYYMHLAGEYHSTDKVMYVTSEDTNDIIVFSKENLVIHTATRKAYQYNTRAYKELVLQYPDQEPLILGILYPADKDKAVEAPNGTILSYKKELVEINEYSLINNLQTYLYNYIDRWENVQYNITDSLYHPVFVTQMQMLLLPALINLRLRACKTNEVHSFHVFHYLASHGLNQFYLPMVTTKQSLWLYRNICHIEKHAGSRDNFTWLIEHLLTERNIPIAEFRAQHGLADMPNEGTLVLEPISQFKRNGLNLAKRQLGATPLELIDMLIKEDPLAIHDPEMRVVDFDKIKYKLLSSASNDLPTKALESYTVDNSATAVFPLEWIAFNHWVYAASTGLYRPYISVNHPKTGQAFVLSPKEAVALFYYAYFAQFNFALVDYPTVHLERVTRNPKPTHDEMMNKVYANWMYGYTSSDEVEMIRVGQPIWTSFYSTDAFNAFSEKLFEHEHWQTRWIANHNHNLRRAFAENIVNDMYMDIDVKIGEGVAVNYPEWFKFRNFEVDNMLQTDWSYLVDAIFTTAVGIDRNATYSLRAIQKAMIALMQQLSSYSIQFITSMIDSQIYVSTNYVVRVDDFRPVLEGNNILEQVDGVVTSKLRTEFIDQKYMDVDLRLFEVGRDYAGHIEHLETGIKPHAEDYNLSTEHHIELDGTVIHVDGTATGTFDLSIPGMKEFFVDAGNEFNRLMRNYWCDCRLIDTDSGTPLIIHKTKFPYFKWISIDNQLLDAKNISATAVASNPTYQIGVYSLGAFYTPKPANPSPYEMAYSDMYRYTATMDSLELIRQPEVLSIATTQANLLEQNGFVFNTDVPATF